MAGFDGQPLDHTGINFRGEPDNTPAPVSRNTELNTNNDAIDDGAMALVQPYSTPDSGLGTIKKYDVKGMFKLDKKSDIWALSDDEIKSAIFNKIKNQYSWINENNFIVNINRSNGIIEYEEKKQLYSNKQNIKAIDITELVQTTFETLEVGELFHIDPEIMNSQYSKFYNNPQFKNAGGFTLDTVWKKTGNATFCKNDKENACVEAYVSLDDASNGSIINIDINRLKKKNVNYYNYLTQKLDKELSNDDKFYKIDNTHIAIVDGKDIITIKNPLEIPVFFITWIIEVDSKVAPPNSIPLNKVPAGGLFYMTTSAVKQIYWSTIKPALDMFCKFDEESFVRYKAGKFNISYDENYFDPDTLENALFTKESLKKEQQKTLDRIEKQKFHIDENIPPEENNWDTRQISSGSYVIVFNKLDFQKVKSTLNEAIDSMFNKFEIKKDEFGESITISLTQLEQELAKNELDYTEFDSKMKKQEIDLPIGDGKTEKVSTSVGNTDKYYWYINPTDKNVVINRTKK
jgi:hypothetical protein